MSVNSPLDRLGAATSGLGIPSVPSLSGVELVAQAVVVEPQGSFQSLLAFTNDRLLLIGQEAGRGARHAHACPAAARLRLAAIWLRI